MRTRSHNSTVQMPSTFASNHGRRHHGIVRRCHAAQLTKNRMWRASSCITGSKVSTSAGGKKPERRADSNSPKAKKLSMHSL